MPAAAGSCGAGALARGTYPEICPFVTDTHNHEEEFLWAGALTMSNHSTLLAKYGYRRRLPHLQKAGAALFVTFCTIGRRILPSQARDIVLEHWLREGGIQRIAGEGPFDSRSGQVRATQPDRVIQPDHTTQIARATETSRGAQPARDKPRILIPRIHLHAVVVMPDHVHVLLTPLRDHAGWPFPLVDILQCCKSATAHRINRLLDVAGPIWEEESFDHVLRSQESFGEKCEYIRQNAVKAGLVARPEDYRWLWVE